MTMKKMMMSITVTFARVINGKIIRVFVNIIKLIFRILLFNYFCVFL
jgi:hypothetical protein